MNIAYPDLVTGLQKIYVCPAFDDIKTCWSVVGMVPDLGPGVQYYSIANHHHVVQGLKLGSQIVFAGCDEQFNNAV